MDFGSANTSVTGVVTEAGKPKHYEVVTFRIPGTERWVQTDYTGRFEVSGLDPGPYTVSVRHPGGGDNWAERNIEIPLGGNLSLEFAVP